MGLDASLTGIPEFDSIELIKTGIINAAASTLTSGGAGVWSFDTQSVTVNHNLGYTPILLAYIGGFINNGFVPIPFTVMTSSSSTAVAWIEYYPLVDSTSITIYTKSQGLAYTGTAASIPIKYYLLRQKSNTTF